MTLREEVASLAGDLRRYIESVEPRPHTPAAKKSGNRSEKPVPRAPTSGGETLESLRDQVLCCTRCSLSKTRTRVVFGEGNPDADLMFIGEAPGRDEDLQGRPFVGRAGQLLTKILAAIDLRREDVFIGNVLKCRPPGNRDPSPEESVACMMFLEKQIEIIRPKIVCALGRIAASLLLGSGTSLGAMRGKMHDWGPEGRIRLIATYHPAACLRNPQYKRPVWEDMQRLRDAYHAMSDTAKCVTTDFTD
jgi:uracil-DNA glycosylase family 4